MKLQTKVTFIIIPIIILGIFMLGMWSIKKSEESTHKSTFLYMNTIIDSYLADVNMLHNLLAKNGLEKIPSFVSDYKHRAFRIGKDIQSPPSGHIFIIDESGGLVFCSGKSDKNEMEIFWGPIVQEEIEFSKTGYGEYSAEGDNRNLYVVRNFKPWHWFIFFSIDDDEAHAMKTQIRNAIVLVASLCSLFSILLILIVFRRFFVVPVQILGKSAEAIAEGKNMKAIDVHFKDELGDLARNMESMSESIQKHQDELKESHDQLENRVKERTAELAKTNERLKEEIEERRRAEEALRESGEKYRSLITNIPDVTWTTDYDFKTSFVSPNTENVIGYTPEEIYEGSNNTFPERIHPEDAEKVEKAFKKLFEKGTMFDVEYRIKTKDGEWIWLHDRSIAVYERNGVMYADGIFSNITSRKRAEVALQESEARHRELVDNAVLGIFQVTKEGKFLVANQRMANIFGYDSQQDFFGDVDNIIKLYVSPEERSGVLKVIDEEGHLHGREMNFKRKDGNLISCNAYARLVQRKDGENIYEGLLEDITDKKKMEAQLQQATKMEAIATLAGGVAHEFNNALMGIVGNIELLKMNFSEDEGVDKRLKSMKSAGHRMSRLTAQLLAYAEGGKYQPKDLRMDDFVIETLPILQHDLSPEVRVETHFPSDISYIKADYAQMQMVLSAILANSNEAVEDEGFIRIAAENKDIDENFTKQHPGLKPGPYVCLTIEDNGKGMDEETRSGIFEPFFTTKFQGRGMGMAAVHGIVRNHDGWISVDSELGRGTKVQIYLPAIEVEIKQPKEVKVEVSTGSGTILMIEDEDVVVEVTQAMLEMLGYRVMVAKTGKDAIHIAETFDGQIDLALLDIKLPDIDGRNLYPLIMKARSNLKVIVFSGYSIDGPAREILDAGAQDFIQKPFSIATLSEKLKEVLEGK